VKVRVIQEVLAPGVEDGEKADGSAEVLRVLGDGQEGPGGCAEQDVVEEALVLKGDGRKRVGQSEDDVEVGDGEKLVEARLKPLASRSALALGAVTVATGVVGDGLMAAAIAPLDVAAEGGRAAGLDGRHHACL
jgi:hypothetical protein